MSELATARSKTRAWACYDCGKCTATCPIARAGAAYSPRRHVLAANTQSQQEVVEDAVSLFACLTCSLCDSRCPAEVAYTSLVQRLREVAYREGVEPDCPHGGALQSMMRMMAKGGAQQDRLGWLTGDLQTAPEQGEVFYFTGCTMYFDALLPELEADTLEGTRSAVRLLNRLGITPVVSPDERCCGHDLLWNGDRAGFEALARLNVELVRKSGAKTLVASCAECVRTWRLDFEPFFEGKPPRILHISELLSERLLELPLKANGVHKVTYQDPCRLGRHLGVYEAPRKVLDGLPGITRLEMPRTGKRAQCCAGGTWSHCDRFAKQIQVERLEEAKATGAEVLVTACPKCQIHFRCAMKDPRLGERIHIETRDIAQLVEGALGQ